MKKSKIDYDPGHDKFFDYLTNLIRTESIIEEHLDSNQNQSI